MAYIPRNNTCSPGVVPINYLTWYDHIQAGHILLDISWLGCPWQICRGSFPYLWILEQALHDIICCLNETHKEIVCYLRMENKGDGVLLWPNVCGNTSDYSSVFWVSKSYYPHLSLLQMPWTSFQEWNKTFKSELV